jgi:hypothetical protein
VITKDPAKFSLEKRFPKSACLACFDFRVNDFRESHGVESDEFRQYFRDLIEDWNSSVWLFVDDLVDFLERVDSASATKAIKSRQAAFKLVANRANCLHTAMVMMQAIQPTYPCDPDTFAPLFRIFNVASKTGHVSEDWWPLHDKIRVKWTALVLVENLFGGGSLPKRDDVSGKLGKAKTKRPNAERDGIWCDWSLQGMTPAKIRDAWDKANPTKRVPRDTNNSNGLDTIKKAVRREKIRRGINVYDGTLETLELPEVTTD